MFLMVSTATPLYSSPSLALPLIWAAWDGGLLLCLVFVQQRVTSLLKLVRLQRRNIDSQWIALCTLYDLLGAVCAS